MNLSNIRINCPRIFCCKKTLKQISSSCDLDHDNNLEIKVNLFKEISEEDQLKLIRSTVLSHIKDIKKLDSGSRVAIEYNTPLSNKLIVSFDTQDTFDYSALQEFEHNEWVGIKYNEILDGQTTKLFFKLIQSTTWHHLLSESPLNHDYQSVVPNPFIIELKKAINPKKDIFYIEKSWTDYKKTLRITGSIITICIGLFACGYLIKCGIESIINNDYHIAKIYLIAALKPLGILCCILYDLLKFAGVIETIPQQNHQQPDNQLVQFV